MMKILLTVSLLSLAVAGCAWVEQADEQTIRIGVGDLGTLAPGLRRAISYPEAEAHCAKFGKDAVLQDLKGKTATWRCEAPK